MYWFLYAISFIGLFFLIFNTYQYWRHKKSNSSKIYKLLSFYLLSTAIIEVTCHIVGIAETNSNLFLSHFIFHCEYTFLAFFFYNVIDVQWVKKVIVLASAVFYIILGVQYFQDPTLFWRFNLFEILFISISLFILGLVYLYTTLGEKDTYYNFCMGITLFMLCSSVIYISGNYDLILLEKPFIDIWIFNYIFFIVYQYFVNKQLKVFLKNE